jgi:transcriptional regulator with GAF, ATPase, and Fis domain
MRGGKHGSQRVTVIDFSCDEMLKSIDSLKAVALQTLKTLESLRRPLLLSGRHEINLRDEVHKFEASLINAALIRAGGNQARAARLLGTKVTTLNSKIKRYGMAELCANDLPEEPADKQEPDD